MPDQPLSYKVNEVRDIAIAYLMEHYGNRPGFHGAHLVGTLSHSQLDEDFPVFKDVDLAVLMDGVDYQEIEEHQHKGLLLECILSAPDRYDTPEMILGDPCLASILAFDSVIIDPEGKLTKLHEAVAKDYALRKWAKVRCNAYHEEARKSLEQLKSAKDAAHAIFAIGELVMYLVAMPTLAHLVPLTHRRGLVQLRPYMLKAGKQDLYEEYLKVLGSADLTNEQITQFLKECDEVFEAALKVYKTPFPYSHKLDPSTEEYLVEGVEEMFEEDAYRESIFWIALFYMVSTVAILNDGTPEQKQLYGGRAQQFLAALGLDSPEAMKERVTMAEDLYGKITTYVDEHVATTDELRD